MSKADQQFVAMCRDILDHGTTTEGQKVRPVWEDGTPAYTIKNFGVTARYDLREEFPALTLRRTALKSAMDEILWIYQQYRSLSYYQPPCGQTIAWPHPPTFRVF